MRDQRIKEFMSQSTELKGIGKLCGGMCLMMKSASLFRSRVSVELGFRSPWFIALRPEVWGGRRHESLMILGRKSCFQGTRSRKVFALLLMENISLTPFWGREVYQSDRNT
jgi:hypothetical protein